MAALFSFNEADGTIRDNDGEVWATITGDDAYPFGYEVAAGPELYGAARILLAALPAGEKWPLYLSDAILELRAAVRAADGPRGS